MDHFCPWMNNAIGARNQKNFLLFLIYTDLVSSYMYVVVAWHMVYCTGVTDDCTPYSGVALQLARLLIFILLFAILFTSSMILNQIYGLAIGLGTIDRCVGAHCISVFRKNIYAEG
jgi:palmitoyltransferase ZDHHC3/7/25